MKSKFSVSEELSLMGTLSSFSRVLKRLPEKMTQEFQNLGTWGGTQSLFITRRVLRVKLQTKDIVTF